MWRAMCFVLLGLASTAAMANQTQSRYPRVADATTDACMANCATQNASCQRVCPTTLSAPCVSSCEAQAQTCRQSCQTR
jgi:hypothetical protein